MTQPEALRLAEYMDHALNDPNDVADAVSAELRRLYAENEALREANEAFGKRQEWWNERMFALEQQRDALLEVAKLALRMGQYGGVSPRTVEDAARAAIAKAEGEAS
jgi:hypothetical protein